MEVGLCPATGTYLLSNYANPFLTNRFYCLPLYSRFEDTIFWDVMSSILVDRYQHFRELASSIFRVKACEEATEFSKMLVTIYHCMMLHPKGQ
jgi:hypothetical protein